MSRFATGMPTFTFTNQGPAYDAFGDTTTGWTGYLLSVQADPGDAIQLLDLGTSSSSTNGFFGTLLQDWWPGKKIATPTPVGVSATDTNGSFDGTDTHLLVTSRVDMTAPFENSDLVHPVGAPPNDASDQWGTGDYLHGEFAIASANQLNVQPLAYLVVHNGTTGSFSLDVVERSGVSGHIQSSFGSPAALTVVPVSSGPPVGFGLQSTTATGTTFSPNGPKANAINIVSDGHGRYSPGFATGVDVITSPGGNGGNGFSFIGYVEISADPGSVGATQSIALELTNHGFPFESSGAQIQSIIDRINANSLGITASLMPASLASQYPDYNALLTVPTPSADEYFGWDFNYPTFFEVGLGDVAAGISVPEPASASALALFATAALARRNKRRRLPR
ncbi:MAG TPA: hypothetical protein VLI90_01400 [Tepidisphaeraceae bacterium]|nr:hypothetical protein [Tepidisphaeraceae bacterium]